MDYRLGKKEYESDPRTLRLATFLKIPYYKETYDFDSKRAKFPTHMWGNDAYGDCVLASEAECMLRLERVETRRTLRTLTDDVVINRYKKMTGTETPGDGNDNGLVMLQAFRAWRHIGWHFGPERDYTISAFGEVDPLDSDQLKAAIYVLGGVHFGFALPKTAMAQTDKGYWDVVQDAPGNSGKPGTWGGHAVYSKRYNKDNFYVKTWGKEIRVSDAFVKKYADEAWGVVDNLNHWRKSSYLDVGGMLAKLREVGVHVDEG
jgi:hypothetical protein